MSLAENAAVFGVAPKLAAEDLGPKPPCVRDARPTDTAHSTASSQDDTCIGLTRVMLEADVGVVRWRRIIEQLMAAERGTAA